MPTLIAIGLQCIERFARVVFGVCARRDGSIGGKQFSAFFVQCFIGNHIVVIVLGFQPRREMGVSLKVT